MKQNWLYSIGLVVGLLYLLYGLTGLIHGYSQYKTKAQEAKVINVPDVPDIYKRLDEMSKIKIRTDLFGAVTTEESIPETPQREEIGKEVESIEEETISLKGIIITPEGQFRAVLKPEDSKPVTLTTGEEINGYLVQAISRTEVILKKGQKKIRLVLYKKSSRER